MGKFMHEQSLIPSRLERLLFPLKHTLLLNVIDPLQWFYMEPLVHALNRSVVVLCHFSLREVGIRLPQGAYPLELGGKDVCSCFDSERQADEGQHVYADIVSACLETLQPTGLVVCGRGTKERQMADWASRKGVKVIYLAQGCCPDRTFPDSETVLDWTNPGCLLSVSSDDKRNIVGVCFRHKSREKRSQVQLDLVKELCETFPAARIGVVQSDGTLIATADDIRLRALPNVRILPAGSWKDLLSRGRVVVSDDEDLLSQASLSGCRPLLYDWDTGSCALWQCPLNGLHVPAWGEDAARKIAWRCNLEIPYCPDEQACGRLHLGCGHNFLDGWLNTDMCDGGDIRFLNAGKPYPFMDEIFEYVFSEHLFEHLSMEEGLTMLQECFRVLKPGGHLRLTTPDLDFLIRLYEHPEEECHKEYIRWSIGAFDESVKRFYGAEEIPAMFVLNNFIRSWGHRMVYNQPVLKSMLEKVGFKNVRICRSGESHWSVLKGVEHHGTQIPSSYNILESMTLEATK
ncbi:class I SAM-dependent methyltransferase [Xylanibacter rodentium]|uniref:class I SAM-dependent methyltransferase n=1 Tax=Xylanibacter rodentium TaxID=2736289 RepID=UPI002587DDBE|nr:methyltransferase domain-containing protein [Xylanibacter rodentium]